MNYLSDNELMLDVKSGQLDKLGILFERYSRILYSFFYRMTGDQELSQDLVQNVFLRILKYRHTFTADGKFTTWMYHLARNVGADHFKKARKFRYAKDVSAWENKIRDEAESDKRLEHDQDLQLLEIALSQLSAEKREVLVLSRYQELKYHEIGQILNCTEGNVKVRIHRALLELKNIFHQLTREKIL